ncbi:MAG: CdaR family protein [Clostridia bacterium]|nr:CdaR family protein [Clostridia bacterium]MDD4665806.1 CdaR family protein [Clostridia bacterium]
MKKFWERNFFYKALAVLLAVLLWLYVNPATEKVFTVSVLPYNLTEGFVLAHNPEDVEVRVTGPSSTVKSLSSKEIKASVNLASAKLGEGTYSVEVNLPPGVEPVLIKPSSVKLLIDKIKEKQLPIRVITQGTVASGYSHFEPVLEPSTVVVRGPSRLLIDLDTALITVNLDQAKDNLVLNPPVTLLTKNGNIVSDKFEISPKNIQVFVPITENTHNKTVSIKPNINGEPKEGFHVSRVVLDPETVKITGSYETLSQIYQVSTAPIDITGITETYSTQVALVSPEGANLLYQPVVKVLVQIEAVAVTKNLVDIPVTVINLAEGKQVILKPDKVQLTLKGPSEEIGAVEKSAVKAFVDVEGLELGVHNLVVKAEVPKTLQLFNVEPSTVEVKIIEKE